MVPLWNRVTGWSMFHRPINESGTLKMDRVRQITNAAATTQAASRLYQYNRKKIDDLLTMVQTNPGGSTIEVAAERMMAMPKEAHQVAWLQTLSVVAKSGNEAHKRILDENRRLKQAPNKIAVFDSVRYGQNGGSPVATILSNDGFMEVAVSTEVDCSTLVKGQHVALANNSLALLGGRILTPPNPSCEFERLLEDGRIMARGSGGQILVLGPGGSLNKAEALQGLKSGDLIEYDPQLRCATKLSCSSVRVREFVGESADVTGADIGGLDEIWLKIEQHIVGPLTNPELYQSYAVEVPRGVLFFGPPGCGKTLMIKAVARTILEALGLKVDAPIVFRVSGPSLLRPYVGEGEALVRSISKAAEEAAAEHGFACILLDDFEMSALHRGLGDRSSPAYSSLSASLISTMDGLGKRNSRVTWMATSNRIDLLDGAILRPGRFGLQIEIRRPDFNACKDILAVHLANVPLAEGHTRKSMAETVGRHIFSAEDENVLLRIEYADAERQEVFSYHIISGAIIAEAVRSAKVMAVERDRMGNNSKPSGIEPDQLIKCLNEQLHSAVLAVTPRNAHQYYLNLPPDRRIVAVDHLYEPTEDTPEEMFVC